MIRLRLAPVALVLLLSACGSSGQSHWYNPFSWWGGSKEVPTTLGVPQGANEDQRPLVAQVTSLSVELTSDGAIVRATGLPPTQGYWDGALVQDGEITDGRIVYRFVLVPPVRPKPVSTVQSREVTVATYISNIKLQQVEDVVVQGASNARSARR